MVSVRNVENVVDDVHLRAYAERSLFASEESAINGLLAVEEVPHVEAHADVSVVGNEGLTAVPHSVLRVERHSVRVIEY